MSTNTARADLLTSAQTVPHDLYALLSIPPSSTTKQITTAYRKTALKYHPDKLGDAFDPDKFHLLQLANEILCDEEARRVYDSQREAKERKKVESEKLEKGRRDMVEKLKEAERRGSAGGPGAFKVGVKRGWQEEDAAAARLRQLEEEGLKRKKEFEERLRREAEMRDAGVGGMRNDGAERGNGEAMNGIKDGEKEKQKTPQQTPAEEAEEEAKIAELEQRIREMAEAKARRRAEKKARKSGIFVPAYEQSAQNTPQAQNRASSLPDPINAGASTMPPGVQAPGNTEQVSTPRRDLFSELKKNGGPSGTTSATGTPKFSFSPSTAGKGGNDFAATMARLKARERQKQGLEEEIRKKEAAGETA